MTVRSICFSLVWCWIFAMKFAEHLGAHITPEWRKQYIQYEEMKAMLYAAVEQAPCAEVVEEEVDLIIQ